MSSEGAGVAVVATVGLPVEFQTVGEVFQDNVVVKPTGHAFHRLDASADARAAGRPKEVGGSFTE